MSVCPWKPFPAGSKNLRSRPEPTQVEHLSDTSFLGELLVFLANVRLDWKVIASYKHFSLFGLVISDGGKKVYNIDTCLTDGASRRSFSEVCPPVSGRSNGFCFGDGDRRPSAWPSCLGLSWCNSGFCLIEGGAWAQCYKTFCGRNLLVFVKSESVCPWQAFSA